jgi:hypothetical protein
MSAARGVEMEHPPGVVAYLVSEPDPMRRGLRRFWTFPADWEPPRMNQRQKFDIRITPLTAEEYAKPLLDIVNEHEKKLRDPQAEPKPKPPQAGVATHSRPAGTEP